MDFFKNEVITAVILSSITTILVLVNLPRHKLINENDETYHINRPWIAIKSFFISFIVTYGFLYFFAIDQRSSLISNMKQGEPTF